MSDVDIDPDILRLYTTIGNLRAELARVTAERDAKAEECREASQHAAKAMEERAALRARVAEQDAKLEYVHGMGLRFGMMKSSDKPEPYLAHTWDANSDHERMFREWSASIGWENRVAKAEQRNAELVAALREIAGQKPEKPDYWTPCGQCERNIGEAEDALARAESGTPASGWLDRHAESFHQVISAEGSDTPASDCTAPTQAKPPMLVGGSYDCSRCGERHPVGPCKNFEKTPAKHRWAYVSGFGEAAAWKCHICGNVVHGDSLDEAVRDSEVGSCDAARSHKGPTP